MRKRKRTRRRSSVSDNRLSLSLLVVCLGSLCQDRPGLVTGLVLGVLLVQLVPVADLAWFLRRVRDAARK